MDFSIPKKYVYVMRGTQWMFKIGISNDPARRVKEVAHKPKIVAQYSFHYNIADRVESFLHIFFKESRRERKGSGKTEWFRLTILELLVLKFLLVFFKILHELLKYSFIIAIIVLIIYLFKYRN